MLGTALVPVLVAVLELGRIHPDEVYQLLEPAYTRAFGYGVLSWEWREGLRNWAFPGFFSVLLQLCAALGVEHPQAYRAVLGLPQLALHAAALAAVHAHAARRVGNALGVWGVLAVGLFAPVIDFAGRTLSESLSAAFLVIACALLDDREVRWRPLAAGVALGLAVVARYPSAVFVVVTLGWLLAKRDLRALGWLIAGGALVAAGLALLDWLTWGRPFHSLLAYLDFNLFSGAAARSYGRKPPLYYLPRLLLWAPVWLWITTGLALRGKGQRAPRAALSAVAVPSALLRRLADAPLPALLAGVYLLVISAAPHKEPRFIYPALVLLAMAAVPGALAAIERGVRAERRRAARLGLVVLSLSPYVFHTGLEAERGDEFRAIVRATRGEATGLLVVNENPWGAGGYFYIGKNIPWLASEKGTDAAYEAALKEPVYNRAVTYDEFQLSQLESAGFRVTERVGRASILVRERAGAPERPGAPERAGAPE